MSQRTYSEEEVAEIIRRAAELESGQAGSSSSGNLPGLSLEELSEVAAEAGLDPENVRKAARQMDSPGEKSTAAITGDEVYAEQWVKGNLTEEIVDLVIADLNHRYNATHEKESLRDNILGDASGNRPGKSNVQRTGKSVEWKYTDNYGTAEVRVLIQPRKEQVRIRVSQKNAWGTQITDMDGNLFEYLSYLPYLAGFVVLLSLPYSILINAIAAILAFVVTQFAFMPLVKKLTDKWADIGERSGSSKREKKSEKLRREVENIADDLAGLVGDSKQDPENSGSVEIPDESEAGQREKDSEAGGRKRSGLN